MFDHHIYQKMRIKNLSGGQIDLHYEVCTFLRDSDFRVKNS